jgi:hypothetical protein
MLTLLRVRRVARLRRRPELNGVSRPLRRAGSWQPSFCETGKARAMQVWGSAGSKPAETASLRRSISASRTRLASIVAQTPPAHHRRQRNGSSASSTAAGSISEAYGAAISFTGFPARLDRE